MARKILLILVIPSVLLLSSFGCRSLNVKVGKSPATSESSDSVNARSSAKSIYQSWNSMEDNVERLQELKNQGAQAFLDRYRQEGRALLRSNFRLFRDSVSRSAREQRYYSLSFFGDLNPGQCKVLKGTQDVFDMQDYGDLRPILQTAVLAKLDPKEAGSLHPTLPDSMDTLTKLIFFELGLKINGASRYAKADGKDFLSSDIGLQVIHEQDEPEAWQVKDEKSLRLTFSNQKASGDDQTLRFEAQVGEGVFENKPIGPREFLRFYFSQAGAKQSLELKNGLMTEGNVEELVYSRRIALRSSDKNRDQLILTDTIRFLMSNSKTRSFSIDKAKGEICALADGKAPTPKPEVPGKAPAPVPKPDPKDNPTQSDDPSQSKK
jgi:hypothetical protein